MSDGYLTTTFGNQILAHYFSGTTQWVGLLASDPGIGGLDGDEFTGGDYEREVSTWTTPSGKTTSNADKLVFDNLEANTLRWFGIFNTRVGDDLLVAIKLDTAITISASGRLVVAAHDITVTM